MIPEHIPPQTLVELLRLEEDQAHQQVMDALDGVTEKEAWAMPKLEGRAVLHSDGSILSIVQHLATCEVMYASAAFRQGEVRWHACARKLEELGADWDQNLAYLAESHSYWVESWRMLPDGDLLQPRQTNWGEDWPTWRIISTISQHASYHAGQISLLRAILPPTDQPPALRQVDAIRRYLRDSPYW